MQVQIKFTRVGSSQVFGNFGPGDLLRCSAAEARHFVETVGCAAYADAKPLQAVPTTTASRRKRASQKESQP